MIFMPENNIITITLPASGESFSVFLRYSPKAKRCTLRVKEDKTELVLPPFMFRQEALSFLENSLPWLEKTLKKRVRHPDEPGRGKTVHEYPSFLDLAAYGRKYPVYYTFLDVPWVGVKTDGEISCIRVSGNVLCPEAVTEALERFILRKAEEFLPEKLSKLSLETGLKYKKCAIRMQSTRWGSCSSSGTISLNAMLLFVPEECVHYVLIHELCHTKHMDHSAFFWQEVAKYVPHWKYYRSLLKRSKVPALGRKKA